MSMVRKSNIAEQDLRKHLLISLAALNAKYVSGVADSRLPVRDASPRSLEITMKAVNELYKEGYFKRLGMNNFMS